MDNLKESWFLQRWKEKLLALVLAIIIWFFVNQSIVVSKTIPNIPVRILNIPQEKAISGLLPNGVYQKRVKLTLSGSRQVIEGIEPGDLEIVLDAATAPDEWPVEISKKNLVSLNPDIDLARHISDVSQPDLVIHLSRLITSDIPVYVVPPKGKTPKGYALIDISPRVVIQSMTGPSEELDDLERSGVALELDLSRLAKEELDKLPAKNGEVLFSIPAGWKKVKVPWIGSGMIPLNSPEAAQMEMLLLKEEPIPLSGFIPLLTVLPLDKPPLPFKDSPLVIGTGGTPYLNLPLLVEGTSELFAKLLAPHLALVIEASSEKEELLWNLVVLSSQKLEDIYVSSLLEKGTGEEWGQTQTEERLRELFRGYLSSLCISTEPGKPLSLEITATTDGIDLREVK